MDAKISTILHYTQGSPGTGGFEAELHLRLPFAPGVGVTLDWDVTIPDTWTDTEYWGPGSRIGYGFEVDGIVWSVTKDCLHLMGDLSDNYDVTAQEALLVRILELTNWKVHMFDSPVIPPNSE